MKDHGGEIVNIIIVLDKGSPTIAHCSAPLVLLSKIKIDNYAGGAELFHAAAEKVTTANRVGSVEEVSAGGLYYLSPAKAYIMGDTMHLDGGWHQLGPLMDIPALLRTEQSNRKFSEVFTLKVT
ncbi:hypothetical protein CCR75_000487 [Bremia lactucae]|uniref:Uncharacterized protein n=1 Tax=Bremia lactucae TaxID=4779 RepID=A0A976IEG4_BRELC|nr:hypothetical protein CCR75_000487 [Bremia lactucae]